MKPSRYSPADSGSSDPEPPSRPFSAGPSSTSLSFASPRSEFDWLVVGLGRMHPALLRRIRQHDLPRLHDLLEVAQIVGNLLAWLLTEEHRHLRPQLSHRRVVLERHA